MYIFFLPHTIYMSRKSLYQSELLFFCIHLVSCNKYLCIMLLFLLHVCLIYVYLQTNKNA